MLKDEINLQDIIRSWPWRIKRLGLTQSHFAENVGLSETVLSFYVSGKRTPSIPTFEEVENRLRKMESDLDL